MKKLLVIFTALMIMTLSSCASTKLLTSESVNSLTTKEFKLTKIAVNADFSLDDKNLAANIFENLPYEKIVAELSDLYGITIDTSLLSKNNFNSEIEKVVNKNLNEIRNWEWNKAVETDSSATITVILKNNFCDKPLSLSVQTRLTDSNGTALDYLIFEDNWSSSNTIVDKNKAAIISFADHIEPKYILTDKGIESYSVYAKNNEAPDGGIYVDTSYKLEFSGTIYDPGIFMLVDPMIFYNVIITDSFEAGKSYTINYKVDRSTFSKYNWSAKIFIDEN